METLIWLVEDEAHLARGLCFNLEKEGYRVEHFARAEPALEKLQRESSRVVSLLVLDVMLPGISGIEMLKQLRPDHPELPVLVLTARNAESDIVAGLDAGADDYLPKPFTLPVLLARVRSLLRRAPATSRTENLETLQIGDVRIHPSRFELERDGARRPLTHRELSLLCMLYERRGEAISRGEILEEVWELHPDTRTRVVDTFVLRLRKLIEPDPSNPKYLLSVRSFGYRLADEAAAKGD